MSLSDKNWTKMILLILKANIFSFYYFALLLFKFKLYEGRKKNELLEFEMLGKTLIRS